MGVLLTIPQLQRMAGRDPLEGYVPDEPYETRSLLSAAAAEDWKFVEDGLDGMASYVEALTGRPSNALSFRKSLLGPFAAVGAAGFAWTQHGDVKGWNPLTLGQVDKWDPEYASLVSAIQKLAAASGIRILSSAELMVPMTEEVADCVVSPLMRLESRSVVTLYDVLFQWED